MRREENIILPVAAGLGLLILLSDSGPGPGTSIGPVGLTPTNFIKRYWNEALQDQKRTGISALFTITQAGLESGWGKRAPRFNYFGIKADNSWDGETQLLDTTEYVNGKKVYVKALFRAYPSARHGFTDHSLFFFENPRYKNALLVRNDAIQFAKAIAKAGYATDPNYADKLIHAMKIVITVLQRHGMI